MTDIFRVSDMTLGDWFTNKDGIAPIRSIKEDKRGGFRVVTYHSTDEQREEHERGALRNHRVLETDAFTLSAGPGGVRVFTRLPRTDEGEARRAAEWEILRASLAEKPIPEHRCVCGVTCTGER